MEILNDILAYLPATIIAFGALVVMMLDGFKADSRKVYLASMVFLGAALIISVYDLINADHQLIFSDMAAVGGTAAFGTFIVVFGAFFTVILTHDYLIGVKHNFPEVYPLLMFCTVGMIVLASANSMVTIFIGLETMSICLYALAGIVRDKRMGVESALKYFVIGAFSTGFFIYGITLIYGATGSFDLATIAEYRDGGMIFWGGVSLLLVAFFFKVSAVPFHMWTPDVYQGAPTTITAFMATAGKTASFIGLLLVLSRALPYWVDDWSAAIAVIAIITMVFGNLVAMVQDNVKRMLAYSSIAHAGYVLVGLAAGTTAGYSAVMYYLFAYTLMNVGAFGIVAYYEKSQDVLFNDVKGYAGLGFQYPIMGVLLSIFLFSLAGIPPFAGFFGKYMVFAAAIDAGFLGLAIVGVLASAASVYYYLRVMVYLYMKEPAAGEEVTLVTPKAVYVVSLAFLAGLTIYFGLIPSHITDLIFSFFDTGFYAVN